MPKILLSLSEIGLSEISLSEISLGRIDGLTLDYKIGRTVEGIKLARGTLSQVLISRTAL